MMEERDYSLHARDMLRERNISEEWVRSTIVSPDIVETGADGNTHYIKAIAEFGGRHLRIVVNETGMPHRIVTIFFDRRVRRNQ